MTKKPPVVPSRMSRRGAWVSGLMLALGVALTSLPLHAQDSLQTGWVSAQAGKARARLLGGSYKGQEFALIEIELQPGWKTYWRNPGDAGLPPDFSWQGSENLAKAELLYPAPHRFLDKSGETLGYKDRVTFPVKLLRKDAGLALTIVADVQYGVCKDICIPAEAKLSLALPAGSLPEVPGDVLSDIPRDQGSLKPGDPVIRRADAVLDGADPRIEIEAEVSGSAETLQGFLYAEGGVYVPTPEFKSDLAGGHKLFVAKLGGSVDVAALKDRAITVVLTSSNGASTADVKKVP